MQQSARVDIRFLESQDIARGLGDEGAKPLERIVGVGIGREGVLVSGTLVVFDAIEREVIMGSGLRWGDACGTVEVFMLLVRHGWGGSAGPGAPRPTETRVTHAVG